MADAAPDKKAAKAGAPKAVESKPRFTARLRYARMSARKMRYVVDLVRGKDFNSAIAILRSCSKRGASFCKKLLESAVGNATDLISTRSLDVDVNKLHLVEARVDPGPIIKRWRPSSQRQPVMIRKRMCHVTFVLEERDLKESRQDRSRRQKSERQKKSGAQKVSVPPAAPAAGAPEEKK